MCDQLDAFRLERGIQSLERLVDDYRLNLGQLRKARDEHTCPRSDHLLATAMGLGITTDWLLKRPGASQFEIRRTTGEDLLGDMTSEVIRLGKEEWDAHSQAGKLPAWINEALPELITRGAVMAELRSIALQAVERARQLYDEQLNFAKIEAQLNRDRERGSRGERSRNERSARELSWLAYRRYVEVSGDVSDELLGDEGRAFRAGLLAYERRHRRAALAAQRTLSRTARSGKPRKLRKPK